MYKVLLKGQYTSGYAKKIAGSYTLVAGFLIHQYMCQYTCCILKELGGILMLCGRYVYGILTFVAGFRIHQYVSVYILYTDVVWKVRIRDSYIRGRIPYTPVYLSVYILYTDGIRRCTDVVWKVRIRDSYIRGRISYS